MKQKNQKICDRLCTPVAKKLHKKCLFADIPKTDGTYCNGRVEVAHHYIHKSKSLALRYDPENLIPLCCGCHSMLHANESFWGGKIRDIKGEEWFAYLESKKPIITRYIDYNEIHSKLLDLLNKEE